ncbi:MAG: flotillin family protein, partial [Leucobacter sp.]|nr:flotillin family protein [Leucobacter sp.]
LKGLLEMARETVGVDLVGMLNGVVTGSAAGAAAGRAASSNGNQATAQRDDAPVTIVEVEPQAVADPDIGSQAPANEERARQGLVADEDQA